MQADKPNDTKFAPTAAMGHQRRFDESASSPLTPELRT